MLKEAVKILTDCLKDRRWCCAVDCELALQLQHMCHYQIRTQSCRTLSNLQGFSAPCNLSLGLRWDDKNNTRRPRSPSHSVLHCNSCYCSNGTFIAKEKDLGVFALNEILVKITCIKFLGEKKKSQQQYF